LRRSGAAALLQPGHPVVDEQVGVVLITRLQLHGGVQVPVLEVGDEPFGGLRQADLGAERGQVLLALFPGEQVRRPVGVLVGADDGDVAGAQLLGQEQNTIASKWRRSTIPGCLRSHTTRRQLPEAKPIPDSGSSSSTGGGSGMKSRRLPAYSRACSNAASTESSEEVACSSKWPTRSNITARSSFKNRCTSTSCLSPWNADTSSVSANWAANPPAASTICAARRARSSSPPSSVLSGSRCSSTPR